MLLSRQAFATPVLICLCLFGISLIQFPRLQKLLTGNQDTSLETLEKNLKSENLHLNLLEKMPSFGYDNLIADWTFINFLQYFGDDKVREKTGYSLSPEYFEVILTRDPRFLEAYINLSASTSLYAGMPERSIAIMEEGLKSLSPGVPAKSYYVWRYKAIDELLFLGNAQAAQESFTQAANWSSKFTDEDSKFTAFISQQTAEFLKRNPGSKSARISTWAMVLNNNIDEKTRKRAISEIEALGGKVVETPEGNSKIIFPPKD